jgi:hypothetical protein
VVEEPDEHSTLDTPEKKARLASGDKNGKVCARCYRTWRKFAHEKTPDMYFDIIKETMEQLATSSCRVCRLIAHVLLIHHITATPITMSWNYRGYPSCIEVNFTWPTIGQSSNPVLLVSSSDTNRIKNRIEESHAKELNLAAVINWIQRCKSEDGDGCKPLLQTRLSALKVIDCKGSRHRPATVKL